MKLIAVRPTHSDKPEIRIGSEKKLVAIRVHVKNE